MELTAELVPNHIKLLASLSTASSKGTVPGRLFNTPSDSNS